MKNVLKLVLKDVWYDKIDSGLKTHEYREYKPFWTKRLIPLDRYNLVEFQKAYRKNAPKMLFKIRAIHILKDVIIKDLGMEKPGSIFDIELGERCN